MSREAFEKWYAREFKRLPNNDWHETYIAWEAWQAAQQNSESEPVAWMFQHEDTGMVSIIDLQQIEWGFEAANPRWKKVSALYITPQPVVDVNQQLVVDKYEKLEPALESLVDLCNNLNIGTYDEVIAAEAALERLYVARWRQKNKRHGAVKGGEQP
jgi:hypothetical protein